MTLNPDYPSPINSKHFDPPDGLDTQSFFTTPEGFPTIATGADLEAVIPDDELDDLEEINRYWAVFPYSYISICRSKRHNEYKYFVVEPSLSSLEQSHIAFLADRLRSSMRSESEDILTSDDQQRRAVVREKTFELLEQYDLYEGNALRKAHAESGLERDAFHSRAGGLKQRINSLVGAGDDSNMSVPDPEGFDGEGTTDYGGSQSTDYLPVVDRLSGHPAYERQYARTVEHVPDEDWTPDDDQTEDDRPTKMLPGDPVEDAVLLPDDAILPTEDDPEADVDISSKETVTRSGKLPLTSKEVPITHQLVDPFTQADESGMPDAFGLSEEKAEQFALQRGDDETLLNDYQVYKILYYLEREFIGYKKIDAIKNDLNIEDISCNGYNEPVFVYHSEYEQIISNVTHAEDELDSFVTMLAQFAGKEVSRRSPQTDATLPDGSRAQLTLGTEVSDHGTNYTIRQFKDIPFTPVDLINWNTYSIDQLATLWLAAEHKRSILVAGGTASGKTTTLNALSLFIPPTDKVVSIEDTRELEIPQRNWTPQQTRDSTGEEDGTGAIDEYDLLESALRQRPDYILMGEVRGDEGQTLFQTMSTGHTSFTTFHADTVDEVVKRFTTDPINVSRTLMLALDMIAMQEQTRVDGQKVRRGKTVTEINDYNPNLNELTVTDVYSWDAETDTHVQQTTPSTLTDIAEQMGWSDEDLANELRYRKIVLSHLVANGYSKYEDVAATLQAFMTDQDTVLELIANDALDEALPSLKNIDNVAITDDGDAEEIIPRPNPDSETEARATEVIDESASLLEEYDHGEDWVPDAVKVEPTDPDERLEAPTHDTADLVNENLPNVETAEVDNTSPQTEGQHESKATTSIAPREAETEPEQADNASGESEAPSTATEETDSHSDADTDRSQGDDQQVADAEDDEPQSNDTPSTTDPDSDNKANQDLQLELSDDWTVDEFIETADTREQIDGFSFTGLQKVAGELEVAPHHGSYDEYLDAICEELFSGNDRPNGGAETHRDEPDSSSIGASTPGNPPTVNRTEDPSSETTQTEEEDAEGTSQQTPVKIPDAEWDLLDDGGESPGNPTQAESEEAKDDDPSKTASNTEDTDGVLGTEATVAEDSEPTDTHSDDSPRASPEPDNEDDSEEADVEPITVDPTQEPVKGEERGDTTDDPDLLEEGVILEADESSGNGVRDDTDEHVDAETDAADKSDSDDLEGADAVTDADEADEPSNDEGGAADTDADEGAVDTVDTDAEDQQTPPATDKASEAVDDEDSVDTNQPNETEDEEDDEGPDVSFEEELESGGFKLADIEETTEDNEEES